jgi:transposase
MEQFLAKRGIPELNRPLPPYSPGLSPPDFSFPEIKWTLRRRRFEDTEDIKEM